MATKKTTKMQISNLTESELKADIKRLRVEISSTRVKIGARKEKNTRKVFNLRKLLSRTLSHLRSKQLTIEAKKGV